MFFFSQDFKNEFFNLPEPVQFLFLRLKLNKNSKNKNTKKPFEVDKMWLKLQSTKKEFWYWIISSNNKFFFVFLFFLIHRHAFIVYSIILYTKQKFENDWTIFFFFSSFLFNNEEWINFLYIFDIGHLSFLQGLLEVEGYV